MKQKTIKHIWILISILGIIAMVMFSMLPALQ